MTYKPWITFSFDPNKTPHEKVTFISNGREWKLKTIVLPRHSRVKCFFGFHTWQSTEEGYTCSGTGLKLIYKYKRCTSCFAWREKKLRAERIENE